ncbi:hypothetical protein ISS85_05310 [Candidatus Microgenomates bacterium]|nr:hypothetical protein [Candidatus Microgenomates bacterium]
MESFKRAKLVKAIYNSDLVFFTNSTLQTLFGIKKKNTLLAVLRDLVESGILGKLEKGKYFLLDADLDDFSLANFLHKPSFISLETALNFYGILSQFPYETTSVTLKKKKEKIINEKVFVYLHIKPSLYWGYQKKKEFLIAEPEKAVLDQIYFTSCGWRRINLEELNFERLNKKKLFFYADKFPKTKRFLKSLKSLKKYF